MVLKPLDELELVGIRRNHFFHLIQERCRVLDVLWLEGIKDHAAKSLDRLVELWL